MKWRLWLLFALAAPTAASAQGHTDIIEGTVRGDSGRAIAAATIIATRAPDRTVFQTTSDSAGAFRLQLANGTGDYLLYVSAPGWKPLRKRITRAILSPPDTVFVVNAVLTNATAQKLATVRVEAAKPKPVRNPDPGTQVGASEAIVDYFTGAVPPELAGDIAALSSTIPGITPMNGGISVLGLDPSQSSVTLNGMAFASGSIPRAARTSTRVSSTTYDPARGWFGGANSNVELSGGGVYTLRDATLSLDAPALQYTDPISAQLGQRFTNVDASIGGIGPLGNRDLYFYSYGIQGSRRSGDAVSLLSVDADVLQHAGIAADSVTRLRQLTNAYGIPTSLAADPGALTTERLSLIARFDRNQLDTRTFQPAKRASAITFFGNWSSTSPTMLGVTSFPSRGARQWNGIGGTQALFSSYYGNDYLATLRSSLSYSVARTTPYLILPAASVLVSSTLDDNQGGIASLDFAGGARERDSRRWTWESIAETQLYATGREAHRISVTGDVRLDGYADANSGGDVGTFTYNSLGALATNQPASYTRMLFTPARTGGEWNAFVALGDLWKASPTLRLQYGARVEANAFTSTVPRNALVDATFGARSDGVPNSLHASPRLGFTWIRRGAGNMGAIVGNKLGEFNMSPTSYLRGGIGEFRSLLSPTLLSDASVMTGLPGTTRSISCIGSAVPVPDWTAYLANPNSAPTSCSDGNLGALADTAPAVRLVDRNFAPPRSWRANLSYASQYRRLTYSIDGTYSLNLDQPGIADLNFRNTPAFTTADEGRTVFVPASDIVAGTGALSATSARVSPAFGRVLQDRSDLRSDSRQLIVTVAPDLFRVSNWWISTSYVLASTRALQRGFDGTTFGSPVETSWDRGQFDARHQFVLRGGFSPPGITVSAFARVMSGVPFTPIVSSDVNGDGFANDRAFVLSSPSTDALIASSARDVRDCLVRQRNAPAARNSCEGPWTTSLNAQLTIEGAHFHLGSRLRSVHLNVANPLGGLDQLLHGSNALRGWGTQPVPDPVLYYVRGFDASARRFQYEVNPRFGATDQARTTLRAPFRATIDVSFNLTPDVAQQQLERYLGPGRGGRPGPRLTVDDLIRRYSRNVSDPYQAIISEADSLLLSREQVAALQKADVSYRAQIDALWLSLATNFAALGDHYDVATAVARQEDALAQGREITRLHIRATLGNILTAIQLQLMPYARTYRSETPLVQGGRTLSP
ncbi:MAG: carboxypeptidase regulatory-like domain-containing protein [Gemmatimonadota bacterium]|nr:carboxypeptidase regulatory-like domain-containing protein [Gemmatimonadota bacterium]